MKVGGLLLFSLLALNRLVAQLPVQSSIGPRPLICLQEVPSTAYHQGQLSVKFHRLVLPYLKTSDFPTNVSIIHSGIPQLDALFIQYRVRSIRRSFEAALTGCEGCTLHQQWGFDQWFHLQFDSSKSVVEFVNDLQKLEALILVAEPVYKIKRYQQVPVLENSLHKDAMQLAFSPDDPRYPEQWHLSNSGLQGGLAGKDIKAAQAWDLAKGNSEVIVGVIDGGVEANHPDLKMSMWAGNGYNFVSNSFQLDTDEHGTHTAGIAAASTNNGVGVSGVAGGDGSLNSSAKIMSLEVFGPSSNALDFGAAFVWAADHGAVIAQNSWGFSSTGVYQQSILDGIDYFMAHGGGTVLKGGLVVFAAGNSNSEEAYYPAYYERVLAVAATNNRDVKSYYSNYGNWVDLCAPGGEQSFANDPKGILSTSPTNINGGYEFLQGTSMACPQVVGAAALVAGRAPGRLSADDVKSILLTTTDDHYAENNPQYKGKLGAGRLNVFRALQFASAIAATPPVEPVTTFSVSLQCPQIALTWQQNQLHNEVLLAVSTTGLFGIPLNSFKTGDTIPGGGKVIYVGALTSFQLPITADSVRYYFKIWSKSSSGSYSAGTIGTILTPFSISSFKGVAGFKKIDLNWERSCRSAEVLLAFSSNNNFGEPTSTAAMGDLLAGGGQVLYRGTANSFTHLNPINGINNYSIWVYNGNEWSKYSKYIAVCQGAFPGPIKEGFETSVFPPPGWQLRNPDAGSIGWERTLLAASSGASSAVLRFYNYSSGLGQQDLLLTPNISVVKPDSIIISFDRAYRAYGAGPANADTLELLLSTDCGASFQSLWKKGGNDLASIPGFFTGNYVPSANDWKNVRMDIREQVGPMSSFMIGFRTVNQYGQQLYLDNVEVYVKEARFNDASVQQWLEPGERVCNKSFQPAIELVNEGKDSLKTVKLYCQLSGPQSFLDSLTYQGPPLPPGGKAQIRFNSVLLSSAGKYTIKAYSSMPNGFTDEWSGNDTTSLLFTVFEPQALPLAEGFEAAVFPPNNWHVNASTAAFTWEKTNLAAAEKANSIWVKNSQFAHEGGSKNELYTPPMFLKQPDSLFLYFQMAHAGPASFNNQQPSDTLEVLLTIDCGQQTKTVYKKWGTSLFTFISSPIGLQDSTGAIPVSYAQWREERVNLTPFVNPNSSFQLVFRNSSNRVNNLFLDNIRVVPQWLPATLKSEGWLIAPTLVNEQLVIRHLLPPTDLQEVTLFNAAGQQILRKKLWGQASTNLQLATGHLSAGTYQVKLTYTNRVLVKKLLIHRSK